MDSNLNWERFPGLQQQRGRGCSEIRQARGWSATYWIFAGKIRGCTLGTWRGDPDKIARRKALEGLRELQDPDGNCMAGAFAADVRARRGEIS